MLQLTEGGSEHGRGCRPRAELPQYAPGLVECSLEPCRKLGRRLGLRHSRCTQNDRTGEESGEVGRAAGGRRSLTCSSVASRSSPTCPAKARHRRASSARLCAAAGSPRGHDGTVKRSILPEQEDGRRGGVSSAGSGGGGSGADRPARRARWPARPRRSARAPAGSSAGPTLRPAPASPSACRGGRCSAGPLVYMYCPCCGSPFAQRCFRRTHPGRTRRRRRLGPWPSSAATSPAGWP